MHACSCVDMTGHEPGRCLCAGALRAAAGGCGHAALGPSHAVAVLCVQAYRRAAIIACAAIEEVLCRCHGEAGSRWRSRCASAVAVIAASQLVQCMHTMRAAFKCSRAVVFMGGAVK